MKNLYARFDVVDIALNGWLLGHSIAILRVCLGAVFLGFGILKCFPHVSPAQNLAIQTTALVSFGLVPSNVALS